jgi:hypothetical protein
MKNRGRRSPRDLAASQLRSLEDCVTTGSNQNDLTIDGKPVRWRRPSQ